MPPPVALHRCLLASRHSGSLQGMLQGSATTPGRATTSSSFLALPVTNVMLSLLADEAIVRPLAIGTSRPSATARRDKRDAVVADLRTRRTLRQKCRRPIHLIHTTHSSTLPGMFLCFTHVLKKERWRARAGSRARPGHQRPPQDS